MINLVSAYVDFVGLAEAVRATGSDAETLRQSGFRGCKP